MKKRFWSNFFMGILAIGLIAGCSNDEWEEGGNTPNPDSEDAVYMNVQVQLPVAGAGTRSETNTPGDGDYGTSTDGTEVGKDYENEVKRVLLVLADKATNKLIAFGLDTEDLTISNTTVKSTHKISKTTLASYYEKKGKNGVLEDNQINVYVFCNPTKGLTDFFVDGRNDKSDWMNKIAEINETPNGDLSGQDALAWGGKDYKGGFLMSTASDADVSKRIPKDLKTWDAHTSSAKAFNLSGKNNASSTDTEINNGGSIRVQRAVARFDFKDGSKNRDQKYDVVTENKGESTVTTIQIELQKMGLVNMSKHFYFLRRVSADGLNDNSTLCGVEMANNYVVDTDAQAKSADNLASFDFGGSFNFCLGSSASGAWAIDKVAREQWYNVSISDVIKGDNDEWRDKDYHIWRYVTENTIPRADSQRNGITTGFVFKGKMVATTDASADLQKVINEATGDPNEDPILYVYGSHMFVRWSEVRAYAIENKTDHIFYETVFGKKNTAEVVAGSNAVYSNDDTSPDYWWDKWYNEGKHADADALKKFKKAATGAEFTLYQSSIDSENNKGYFCYYYYWNRHNNNGNDGVMGPMEFAVVRNNVYKLAVTGIKQLGHPRVTENDPDPVDPNKPDEEGDVYITLAVEVLPWTVRVNNIEF